jgi:hypothetical protein
LEGPEALIDAEEGVLDELPSVVFVADERERDGERTALVPFDEPSKRHLVSVLRARDELTIFLGFLDAG